LQLVAKGRNDIYITGDPQITFFKIVYRRHTNFGMYPNYLNFDKELDFGQSSKCRLRYNGDLLTQLYLEVELPDIYMRMKQIKRKDVKNILNEYGIQWNYDGRGDDIITVDVYNKEIIPLINDNISKQISILNNNEIDLAYLNKSPDNFVELGIKNGVDLVESIIINKSKGNISYSNLINYLVKYINTLELEELQLLTELFLYNYDDIVNIIYNTFMKYTSSAETAYPDLVNIYNFGDVIMYNLINYGNYIFLSQDSGILVSLFFGNIINESLKSSEFELTIMSIIIINYYFSYLNNNNEVIVNSSDVQKYKTRILDNIEWNIKKTINMLIKLLQILNNTVTMYKGFIIGIKKKYEQIAVNKFNSVELFNIIQSEEIENNFYDQLTERKLPKEPNNIQHFFGESVRNEYKKFENNILTIYQTSVDPGYFDEYTIWERLIYNDDYSTISLLDTIPLYLVEDIPIFVLEKMDNIEILRPYKGYFGENSDIYTLKDILNNEIRDDINISSSYLDKVKQIYMGENNRLILSLFMPSKFYKLSDSVDNPNYKLIKQLESEQKIKGKDIDLNKLLSIEYIILIYLFTYFEIIDKITSNLNKRMEMKKAIYDLLKIFRYNDYVEIFPSYSTYVSNGYSLYSLFGGIALGPKYVDATCSIYYDYLKKNIVEYNNFFDNILSYNNIQNKIGQQMSRIILLFNNNTKLNYYYNQNLINNTAEHIIQDYLYPYLYSFTEDIINSKSIENIYNIKNIVFLDRIINYYESKQVMGENIYATIIKEDPTILNSFININEIIKFLIQELNYAGQITVFEFTSLMCDKIKEESALSEQEKKIFLDITENNIFLMNKNDLYNEQQKIGIFNSLGTKTDVIHYIIYLLSKKLDLSYLYNYVYLYKFTDISIISPIYVYIAELTDEQINFLLFPENYNMYNNTAIRISGDYNIDFKVEEDVMKYFKILDSFTEIEYKKYGIVSSDILILKITPLMNYHVFLFTVATKEQRKKIREDSERVKNLINQRNEDNYNSLIKTHKNLKTYYEQSISRSINILNRISVEKKKRKIKIRENINNRQYEGSELEDRLTKLINLDRQNFKWIKELGHYLIENISIEIGGQLIEDHDSDWNRIQHQIFFDKNKDYGYNKMIGNVPELYMVSKYIIGDKVKDGYKLSIPVNFWFSKYYQSALPLVALPYTDIDITVKLRNLEEVATWNENASFMYKPKVKCQMLGNYIYLEEEERKRICENRIENLIEIIQKSGEIIIGNNILKGNIAEIEPYFNYSSKFILAQIKFVSNSQSKEEKFNWTDNGIYEIIKSVDSVTGEEKIITRKVNPVKNVIIKLNGKFRESAKEFEYYNLVQSYKSKSGTLSENMLLYSFALDIPSLQPSGSVNMSKINNFIISLELNEYIVSEINKGTIIGKVKIYSYSYNILRIMSGLAGLGFYY